MDNFKSVQETVREAEVNYIKGSVLLGQHVQWSLKDTIERIFAYLNSRHTTGDKDSLGRDKPFFNIVTAAVNIWTRATDLDRKDITVLPDTSDSVAAAYIATVLLQDWMKRQHFGTFLNAWGRTLAQYGSAVVKFVEKNGELVPSVVPWNRLIVDPIDFDALPRIEKFYKTPAQLRAMKEYDQTVVENLIQALRARRTLQGTTKDNKADFVELYEVHGEMPAANLKDSPIDATDEEKETYRQQMHVVSYVQGKGGKYQDFTLFKGKEAKDPYMITHLMPEDGRTLAIGAVETLFDAQWMQNHTMKAWKDRLDIASRVIFQTADSHFQGRNVLTAIESGDILIHGAGADAALTTVNVPPQAIGDMQSFREQWAQLSQDITSTPDAQRGSTLPSGTAYKQAALLTQASNSFFELMTENKGLALEDMLRTFVIPFFKKKLNHNKQIAAILESGQISKLDAMYIPREAVRRHNEQAKAAVLAGQIPSPFNQAQAEQGIKQELAPLGGQRFFSPGDVNWTEVFKDLEWKLDVGITNEQHDKQVIFQTLTTILQTLATNPMILQDPNAKMVFNKILEQTGVLSPVELSAPAAQPAPQPPQPGNTPLPTLAAPQPTASPLAALNS